MILLLYTVNWSSKHLVEHIKFHHPASVLFHIEPSTYSLHIIYFMYDILMEKHIWKKYFIGQLCLEYFIKLLNIYF